MKRNFIEGCRQVMVLVLGRDFVRHRVSSGVALGLTNTWSRENALYASAQNSAWLQLGEGCWEGCALLGGLEVYLPQASCCQRVKALPSRRISFRLLSSRGFPGMDMMGL